MTAETPTTNDQHHPPPPETPPSPPRYIISAQSLGGLNGIAAEELALAGNSLAFGGLPLGPMAGYPGAFGAGYGLNVAPTSGGSFAVTSFSPISPTGITVLSENAIEGPLAVTGQLPFLGAVALEGTLPTAGAGAINYGCGDGNIGIVSEGLAPAAPVAPAYGPVGGSRGGYGPGMAGPAMAGPGLGYNSY